METKIKIFKHKMFEEVRTMTNKKGRNSSHSYRDSEGMVHTKSYLV